MAARIELLPALFLIGCAASTATPVPPKVDPAPHNEAPPPAVPEKPPAPVGPQSLGPLPAGTSFKVLDISKDDAYVNDKQTIVGLTCTVTDELHENEPGWYGGSADCSDGTNYYFYEAAVSDVVMGNGTGGAVSAADPPAVSYGPLTKGTRFKVEAISVSDAYYDQKATIVGLTCTANADMYEGDPGWYAGDAACSDGNGYYFYRASISGVAGSSGHSGVGGVTGGAQTQDPDRDYDGIIDSRDSCPDSPEDRDMDKDYDGCPE